jgi:uncharacterized protein (DUF2141 family)
MRATPFPALLTTAALALSALAAPHAAGAQTPAEAVVRVSVTNIRAQQGFIMVALYDEANWGRTAVTRARVPVTGDVVAFTLTAPAPGRYAIRMFQDVNGDGAMDTNVIGIPTEPIGFSNNAPLQFGPPAFDVAAFEVAASGAAQSIALR